MPIDRLSYSKIMITCTGVIRIMFNKLSCDRGDEKIRLFVTRARIESRVINWCSCVENWGMLGTDISNSVTRPIGPHSHISPHRCWFVCSLEVILVKYQITSGSSQYHDFPPPLTPLIIFDVRLSGTGRSSEAPLPSSQSPAMQSDRIP